MTSKSAQPGEHPYPGHLLDYVRKITPDIGPDYARRTALWLREHYPVTAPKLTPELRAIYVKYGGDKSLLNHFG